MCYYIQIGIMRQNKNIPKGKDDEERKRRGYVFKTKDELDPEPYYNLKMTLGYK